MSFLNVIKLAQSIGSSRMGASLAVVLANFCMTSIEKFLQNPYVGRENKIPDKKGMSIVCNQLVNF